MSEENNLTSTSPRAQHKNLVLYFVTFVLFVLTWLGGFWLWQQHQILSFKLKHSQQSLMDFNNQLSNLNKQLSTQNNTLQTQQNNLSQLQNTLEQTQASISRNQNSWRLIEAEHLLAVANIALQVQNNIPATTLMLQNAAQTLRAIGNPLLNPTQEKINADLLKLKAIPSIDLNNLYNQLSTLAQQTQSLPIVVNQYSADSKDNLLAPAVDNSTSVWQQSLYQIKKALSELVIIRRTEAPVSPLPSTFQQAEIQRHLSLLFSQAQSALLLRQNTIYQATLNQIITLINYYTAMNPASKATIAQIKTLQTDISPSLPDISDALLELHAAENKINAETPPAQPQGNKS